MTFGEIRMLSEEPDYRSPSGGAEIRLLLDFPQGAIAHAVTKPGETSEPAILDGITEMFYVLGGSGQLWRGVGETEQVVTLRPGRLTTTPAGVQFQYSVAPDATEALRFLVVSAPRWERKRWQHAPTGYFNSDRTDTLTVDQPGAYRWRTHDLRYHVDYLAPDGSEIRLLDEVEEGGVAHCSLPAGATSQAVKHKTVAEIWYCASGFGRIARRSPAGDWEVRSLCAGVAVSIPVGVEFQFQATGERLELILGTFPHWPGADEAMAVGPYWSP